MLEKRLATNPEPHSQARLLADMAETLDGQLGRAQRGARRADPRDRRDAVAHRSARARARAREAHRPDQAVRRRGRRVVDRLRRKDDPPLIANLLMRAGEALEQDAERSARRGEPVPPRRDPRRAARRGVLRAGARRRRARRHRRAGPHARQDVRARRHRRRADAGAGRRAVPPRRDLPRQRGAPQAGLRAARARVRRRAALGAGRPPAQASPRRTIRATSKMHARCTSASRATAATTSCCSTSSSAAPRCRGATPQQIREAVDVAVDQGQDQRAEALLVRAVAAARDTVDGLGSAPWAVLALAERRLAAGDLTQARDLTYEIAPIADGRGRSTGSRCGSRRARSRTARSTSPPTSTSSCASAARPIARCGSRCSRSTASSATAIGSAA